MSNKILLALSRLVDNGMEESHARTIFELFNRMNYEINLLKDDLVLLRAEMTVLWDREKIKIKTLQNIIEMEEGDNNE